MLRNIRHNRASSPSRAYRAPAWLVLVAAILLCGIRLSWAEVDYTPVLEAGVDKSLAKELRANSYLFQFQKNKPLSRDGLVRRADDDVARLRDVMIGHGFYGADIRTAVTGAAEPYTVTLTVETGPAFTIGDYRVTWLNKAGRKVAPPAKLDFKDILTPLNGTPATPADILEAERLILERLRENGYPLPQVKDRQVLVDHATRLATVDLTVQAGTAATFAKTAVKGQRDVNEDFIRRRIGWQDGDTYNIAKVVTTRKTMLGTGLFSSVDVLLDAKGGGRQVPVTIQLEERPFRTIGAGLGYSTSRSVEGKVFWEHRNLKGGAEKLRVEADAGIDRYGLGALLTLPDFGGTTRRSLQVGVAVRQEFLDAYDKTSYSASTSLSHAFNDQLSLQIGGGMEFSQIKEKGQDTRDFILLSLPTALKYDSSNDPLDPTSGWRASAGVTPYMALNQSQESFIISDLSASHYLPLNKDKVVFANRVKLGAIFGDSTASIPADKRLYSGGGGSVRGYGYQLVSPLDANDDPTGGRFQVEVGSEMRFRVTEDIGLVTFVEGGRVTEDLSVSGDEKFLWAAGIGARYYTAVGPVRMDIAVPMNGRDKDDAFQVYFSLGQAF